MVSHQQGRHEMGADEIRERWRHPNPGDSDDVKHWDALASNFSKYAVPSARSDKFMALIDGTYKGRRQYALDVGCGAGQYSIALAARFRHVYGTDISEAMIDCARGLASKKKCDITYEIGDWASLPEGNPILSRKYDIVIGHMTPAINSAETLEKMISVCRGMCYLAKPTRRKDAIADGFAEAAGLEPRDNNDLIPNILSLLWYLGYNPCTQYWSNHWGMERNPTELKNYFLRIMNSGKPLGPDADRRADEYLESITVDGTIKEDADVLITNIYWRV